MLAVLNKRWLSKGWRVMDTADSEPMALTWIEILNRHGVPYNHYFELYQRSVDLRIRMLNEGLEADDFSADMMAACWPSLEKELRERTADRTLTATAMTQCLRCHGSGMESIFDENGKKMGVRPGCKHEYLDESDPNTAGMDAAIESLKIVHKEESAVDICKRVERQIHYELITAIDEETSQKAWAASRTWAHAEKYCRENAE